VEQVKCAWKPKIGKTRNVHSFRHRAVRIRT